VVRLILCILGCSAASMASTHKILGDSPKEWQPKILPDTVKCSRNKTALPQQSVSMTKNKICGSENTSYLCSKSRWFLDILAKFLQETTKSCTGRALLGSFVIITTNHLSLTHSDPTVTAPQHWLVMNAGPTDILLAHSLSLPSIFKYSLLEGQL
jgi:hypothetical protein